MRDVIYVTEFGDWGMYQRVRLYDTTDWTELDWELLESAPASERQARAAEIVAYRAAIKTMVAEQREERMTA
jgi:hypothetical protein